jgi:hypothetical protein
VVAEWVQREQQREGQRDGEERDRERERQNREERFSGWKKNPKSNFIVL